MVDFASEIINKKRDTPHKARSLEKVHIISWVYFILAFVSLAGGIFLLAIAPRLGGTFYDVSTGISTSLFSSLVEPLMISGIFLIVLSPILFFTARGLRKKKKWARTLAIIISLFGVVGSLLSLVQGSLRSVLSLGLWGIMIFYLMFDKEVKEFFK